MSSHHKSASAHHKPTARAEPIHAAAKSTRGAGFWLAALLYFILAFFSPLSLRTPLWFALAFVLIPLIVGFVAARGTAQIDTAGQRFHSGFWACGIPHWFYVIIALGSVLNHVGWTPFARILVWFGVASIYATLAGFVAGMTGIWLFRQADRQKEVA